MKELLKRIIENMEGEIAERDELEEGDANYSFYQAARAEACEDYIEELREVYQSMKE
jgi:hypothetical protein